MNRPERVVVTTAEEAIEVLISGITVTEEGWAFFSPIGYLGSVTLAGEVTKEERFADYDREG